MNGWRLIARGLAHHWRTHAGVVAGVACATAALVGALVVGDSVRLSLRQQAMQRVGRFDSVMACGDRFVTTALADRLRAELDANVCSVVQLPGVANRSAGPARAGIVDVFGVDDTFFAMSSSGRARPAPAPGHALLNRRVADQLGVTVGEEVVLRVERPSLMPQEATMATVDDVAHAVRVEVDGVLDDDDFGRFGLRASQVPPFNVFVARSWLAEEIELQGRANLLLVDANTAPADAALAARWQLEDAELELREEQNACELRSGRVFLDDAIVAAATEVTPDGVGLFTYFVNSMRSNERTTPYSMVCGVGPLGDGGAVAPELAALAALAPTSEDGLTANTWLAEDLGAARGTTVDARFYVMNEQLQLQERGRALRVSRVTPLAGAAADPTLMPEFPGLAEVRSCTEWEPGVPVELDQLDDRDQRYWDDHRGTPKGFVTLATARSMWANRFGTLTAIRAPRDAAPRLRQELMQRLTPASIGLFFQDLRGPALAASDPATDFGALYLGLSLFLIVAAMLLTVLLVVFGVERRAAEIGALLAVGFEPRRVRGLFAREAIILTILGGALGAAGGVGYSAAVLEGLGTLWQDTVGQTTIHAFVRPVTLLTGGGLIVATSMIAIWWALRAAARRPATELLASSGHGANSAADPAAAARRARASVACALVAAIGAVTLIARAEPARATSAFFGGGALLLVAALFVARVALAKLGGAARRPAASLRALALRGAGRRPGRSLATVALLACGAFLVLAIQANRLTPPSDPSLRSSGTGGFALFGRSTLPVLRDLGTAEARDAYALEDDALQDVAVVPLRVRPGDDASCLNLATAQNPQLVGVAPAQLDARGAFRFTRTVDGRGPGDGWQLLDRDLGPEVVPAVGDGGSVAWALKKKVGDALTYRDERGDEFEVRIVGTVADSILQGNLLIADRHMRARFPSASGFRMFLIDAPAARRDAVAEDLGDALSDFGLELTPTAARLAAFQTIQNTYLAIFQLLGGLGMLLGTAGLGVVVLRNALERRSEFAVAHALGYTDRDVRRMIWTEHATLLGMGLAAGVMAAAVAMIPTWSDGRALPTGSSALLVVTLGASGAFWVWAASRAALRGAVLDRLRDE